MRELRVSSWLATLLILTSDIQARSINDWAYYEVLNSRATSNSAQCALARSPKSSPGRDTGSSIPQATTDDVERGNKAYASLLAGGAAPAALTAPFAGDAFSPKGDLENDPEDEDLDVDAIVSEFLAAPADDPADEADDGDESDAAAEDDANPQNASVASTEALPDEPSGSVKKRGLSAKKLWDKLKGSAKTKLDGEMRRRHEAAQVKVKTDESDFILYTPTTQYPKVDLEKEARYTISTKDLSGCTVAVIASPYATIMLHIWERRGDALGPDTHLLEPYGPAQSAKDNEFMEAGKSLLAKQLQNFPGSAADRWQGFFPIESTSVVIIAPANNPDYSKPPPGHDPNVPYVDVNPWYTDPMFATQMSNPKQLWFPNAVSLLQEALMRDMVPGRPQSVSVESYRRRGSNDPKHGTDDREFIQVWPWVDKASGQIFSMLGWDGGVATLLHRLA